VTAAIRNSVATFSQDVTAHSELSDLSSLTSKRVVSVIVVPLVAERRSIGAIYLDSTDPLDRLNREHFEFAAVIGEHVGPALERRVRLKALEGENQRLKGALRLEHSLVGCGPAMREVSERIARIARTDATVMIRGNRYRQRTGRPRDSSE
jgi:transcriptional regulator with GAF, ATPase, and Fis domain